MSDKGTIGARINWHWYWNVTRRTQRIPAWIAHRVPRWLKYWVYIDVLAEATTRPPLDKVVVGEVRAMDVLDGLAQR